MEIKRKKVVDLNIGLSSNVCNQRIVKSRLRLQFGERLKINEKEIQNFQWMLSVILGRGGGQVVSVLAFYSDEHSSIPAEVHSLLCKLFEKNENKEKEYGIAHLQKNWRLWLWIKIIQKCFPL